MLKRRAGVIGLIVVAVLSIGLVAVAVAQPPGGGMPGGPGPGGMPPIGMMMAMMPSVMAVEGNSVYVVKGNDIYRFDAETLELLAHAQLPMPDMPPPPGQ